MKIVFASSNPHKLVEVRAILEPLGMDVVGLDAFGDQPPEPVEDADTFEGNARIKALAYATALSCRCLADDSGLVVDAIGGRPGIHSARFAGEGTTRAERDAANNALLLQLLASVPPGRRTARFVCAMCLADPDASIVAEATGSFDGVITEPRGSGGFGYDPLLFIPELGRTSAELSAKEKNARSHRGNALRSLVSLIAS